MPNRDPESKNRLLLVGAIFGIVLTIVVIVTIRLGVTLEAMRDDNPIFLKDLYLWAIEWAVIIGAVLLIRFVWKKLVEPYR